MGLTPSLLLPRYGGTCQACGVEVGAPPRPRPGPGADPEAGALYDLAAVPRLLCHGCGLGSAPAPDVPPDVLAPLYPYQREGVAWLLSRWCALLADQQGLGKTIQVLSALRVLHAPAVIVAPTNAVGVWCREAARWAPAHRPASAPTKSQTHALLSDLGRSHDPARPPLVVCNPERLKDEPDALPPGCVVVHDEAHHAQNPRARRTRRWRALVAAALGVGGRAWLLTGTPLRGRPDNLWGVLGSGGVLHRAAYRGRSWFDRLMVHRDPQTGDLPPAIARAVDAGLARVMLRRLRRDVLPDLPTKRWESVEVPVDRATIAAVGALLAEVEGRRAARRAVAEGRLADPLERGLSADERERRRGAVDRFAARATPADVADVEQLVADVLEEDDPTDMAVLSRVRAALSRCKIAAAQELAQAAEEEEEPLVVFSAHRGPVEALAEREGWALIAGGTPAERRTALEERFQRGELRGLALTIGAGATALTLTRAARAVFVDLSWTPADNEQAEDRICRIGQDRGCLITRLVADHPVDRLVTLVLDRKRALIDASGLGV